MLSIEAELAHEYQNFTRLEPGFLFKLSVFIDRVQTSKILYSLTDRQLSDIGLERASIPEAVRKYIR